MLLNCTEYYFSPTGGTKAVGDIVSRKLGDRVNKVDLGREMNWPYVSNNDTKSHVAVFVVPVYGGRILSMIAENLKKFEGHGKPAVTIVVYGNRAYEDALLELNNIITEAGYNIIGSAAAISRHSMSPEVAKGRPDDSDAAGLQEFAMTARKKLEKKLADPEKVFFDPIKVPGNFPYREGFAMEAAPIINDQCTLCLKCDKVCPTFAVTVENGSVTTITDLCMLCMACVAICPSGARVLPDEVQAVLDEKLKGLKDVRNENEYFI